MGHCLGHNKITALLYYADDVRSFVSQGGIVCSYPVSLSALASGLKAYQNVEFNSSVMSVSNYTGTTLTQGRS